MPDIVFQFEQDLRKRQADPSMIDSWVKALRSDIAWVKQPVPKPEIERWIATSGDWVIQLFRYPMVDRDGNRTTRLGRTCTMVSGKFSQMFGGLPEESPDWERLADWLLEGMNQPKEPRDFMGAGRIPSRDDIEKLVAKHKLRLGDLDLRQPDQLREAVHWLRDLIAAFKTDPAGWGIPRDGSEFHIWRSEQRVRVVKGQMTMPTRISFYALGYKIENDAVSEHDDMMCHLWATLYEP